ncbi:Uncharacterised protein [Salmonella enterica subsp. enterica serovar Bovismorbificans]|uniref:Uncharacterized protein n=1 Tax=Salmonella enterica subsp. enterica serovar Bovismorbificans TaxID=58097 RepID=A0A655CSE2_SALET|nr:Uncharacterised protein [Salmonella enterica subsp. enterica serovar Bovismorbificans]
MIEPRQRRIKPGTGRSGRHGRQIVITGNDLSGRVDDFVIESIIHIKLEAIQHHPGHVNFQMVIAHHQPFRYRSRRGEQCTIISLSGGL